MLHGRVLRPLQDFLDTETAGGVLLLGAAIAALIWANLPGDSYHNLWFWRAHVDLTVTSTNQPLFTWVNDGLMAIFFFVVGLEIRRELTRGELADRRRAALPVCAAAGGMLTPALIYAALNAHGDGARGWGIPMATDIAFAVGALSLVGRRVPVSLKIFLLALAIVDDLGAIAVIAMFYTDDLSLVWLGVAASLVAAVVAARRTALRSPYVYAAIALATWFAVRESGVHATIAGVAFAFALPDRDPQMPNNARALERVEDALHPWTSYMIIPIFAVANAGIELNGGVIRDAASSPVTLGVVLGLAVGKPVGIALFSIIAVRAGIAALPAGVRWVQLGSVAMIAGIGFTVSLFIAGLAFGDAARVDEAKIGTLAGSLVMGVAGLITMRLMSRPQAVVAESEC